ncbi:hypothetical protein QQF64_029791, partial [Cirrhinus molitorella]
MKLLQIKSDFARETQMVYSITGEGADQDPKGIFTVERLSGNLFVTQPLDREKKASYRYCRQTNGNVIRVIDQNDNKPVFIQNPVIGHVHEAAEKDYEFMTVTATDADDPETGNGMVNYKIISQEPQLPKPNMFDINILSGTIRVREPGMDRKQWPRYTLLIEAADMEGHGLSSTGTAVITVTEDSDNKPQIVQTTTVPENSRGPFPMKLLQIKSDFARETQMVYSITGEGADQDPKGIFTVERLSGNLFVTQPLDREKKASYRITVHAKGLDVSIADKPMEIVIRVIDQNDNKPVFIQNPVIGHVHEAAEKDYEFMTVTATDADDPETGNGMVNYKIISQEPQLPKPNMFDINILSGTIRVREPGMDRKQWPRYTLLIEAADMEGHGLSSTGTAVITVTEDSDNKPQIVQTTTVPENSRGPFPMKLFQIKSDFARETQMVYSITGEGADQDPKGIFTVERLSGNLFVTQPLDREKKASYRITVHAKGLDVSIADKPMEIVIHVIDQNDNKPVFIQNPVIGHVHEAAEKDYEFMTVTATDADDPETGNGMVNYKIISQEPQLPKPNMFDINILSGTIRVREPGMDRKQWPRYTLLIEAADMEGHGLSTTGTAVITVTEDRDNKPQIVQTT